MGKMLKSEWLTAVSRVPTWDHCRCAGYLHGIIVDVQGTYMGSL